MQKYGLNDVRNVLERASARETAARVAGGALAKAFLRALGIEVVSHVAQIASVRAPERHGPHAEDFADVDASPVRCLDADATRAMVEEINVLRKAERVARRRLRGARVRARAGPRLARPLGERMDGRIGAGDDLIQAIKGCGIGEGFDLAGRPGSEAHDEIFYAEGAATSARRTAPAGSRAA